MEYAVPLMPVGSESVSIASGTALFPEEGDGGVEKPEHPVHIVNAPTVNIAAKILFEQIVGVPTRREFMARRAAALENIRASGANGVASANDAQGILETGEDAGQITEGAAGGVQQSDQS